MVRKVSDWYMPTDMQYKDDLRKQRDNWKYVMQALMKSPNFEQDENIQRAYEMAKREHDRILESLQD